MHNDLKEFYFDKRVLVLGSCGFVGSWLCLVLETLGAKVYGASLGDNPNPIFTQTVNIIHWWRGDVCDYAFVYSLLKDAKPEIVINLTVSGFLAKAHECPKEAFATNVQGAVHILEAVRVCGGVKAVLMATTDKVYMNDEKGLPFTETDRLGSATDIYSTTKSCVELVCEGYRQAYFSTRNGRPALATVRASNIIGGCDHIESRIVPYVLRSIKSGCPISLRNPSAVRAYQSVLDAVFGYIVLARQLYEDASYAGGWNIGPCPSSTLRTDVLVQLLLETAGANNPIERGEGQPMREADVLKLDIKKASRKMDWKPRRTIEQTVKDIVEMANCQDVKCTALKQIQRYLDEMQECTMDTGRLRHENCLVGEKLRYKTQGEELKD